MKISELLSEAKAGREMWPVMNKRGQSKKFAKMDGWWEKPAEVKAWQQATSDPKDDRKAEREDRARERQYDKEDRAANKKPKIDLEAVYNKAITVVGNTFPDGDPIDTMIPWLKRQGVEDFHVGDTIDAAFKKYGHGAEKKGMYAYMAIMWDDMSRDAMHDAKQAGKHFDSPFIEWDGDKPEMKSNPWK